MSKNCTICLSNYRLAIDHALAQRKTMASISREFGVPESNLANHRNHLSKQMVTAVQQKDMVGSPDILADIEDLISKTKHILHQAEKKKQYGIALAAIREARGRYELLSKIAFSLCQDRASELELERARAGEPDPEAQALLSEMLEVLTDAEHSMLKRIHMKMLHKDRKMITIPDPDDRLDFTECTKWTMLKTTV